MPEGHGDDLTGRRADLAFCDAGDREVKLVPVPVDGAYLIEPEPHEDERGSFFRIWSGDELAQHGLDADLAQCSISRNPRAGTLRGLHFQEAPHEETKIVRCLSGALFDVIVDLRAGSSTEGRWFGATLDANSGLAMYVPKGCAHGFQTLLDDTDVLYLISQRYVPGASTGVRWDDRAFGIEWPEAPARTISERDLSWPDYGGAAVRR